jgi:hypothetical protein
MVLVIMSLPTEGIPGERQPAPVPTVVPQEDLQVIEMLDLLELMELAEYMEMLNDLTVSVEDEGNGDENNE